MRNKLTFTEAMHFLESVWGINALDHYVHSVGFDVVLPSVSETQVKSEIGSFLATIDREIDPNSIQIIPDRVDEPRLDIVQIIIRLGA